MDNIYVVYILWVFLIFSAWFLVNFLLVPPYLSPLQVIFFQKSFSFDLEKGSLQLISLEVEPQPQNIQNQAELLNPGNYVGLNLDKKEPKHIAYTCWYESWQQLVKVRSIQSGHICSPPSPGHGALTASQGVQHLECHPATDSWQAQNVPGIKQCVSHTVLSAPQFSGNSLLPCWRNGFQAVILVVSQARHTGDSTPVTSSILVPQQSAWPSPCVSHSWETDSKQGKFPGQEFSLYLVLHCNKFYLDQVPPLEQSHFSTMVRVCP